MSEVTLLISDRAGMQTQGSLAPRFRFLFTVPHQQGALPSLPTLTVQYRQTGASGVGDLQVFIQSIESIILVLFPNQKKNFGKRENSPESDSELLSLELPQLTESAIFLFLPKPKPEDGWSFPIHSFIHLLIHLSDKYSISTM